MSNETDLAHPIDSCSYGNFPWLSLIPGYLTKSV